MKVIAVTGGVASGKNFIAQYLADKLDAKIFDADFIVHDILNNDKNVIAEVAKNFAEAFDGTKINRNILGAIVLYDEAKLAILEQIIHPQVRVKYKLFLNNLSSQKFVILNIPLILEKKGYNYDILIAIQIFKTIQQKRFILRAKENNKISDLNMKKDLAKKFSLISKRQFSNKARINKATFVIDNNHNKDKTIKQINKILLKIG